MESEVHLISSPFTDFAEGRIFVELFIAHSNTLRYPASKGKQVDVTVGAREVVATHHFHVGLLYQRDPKLVLVAGKGAQKLVVAAHRKVVVDDDLTCDAINV